MYVTYSQGGCSNVGWYAVRSNARGRSRGVYQKSLIKLKYRSIQVFDLNCYTWRAILRVLYLKCGSI